MCNEWPFASSASSVVIPIFAKLFAISVSRNVFILISPSYLYNTLTCSDGIKMVIECLNDDEIDTVRSAVGTLLNISVNDKNKVQSPVLKIKNKKTKFNYRMKS